MPHDWYNEQRSAQSREDVYPIGSQWLHVSMRGVPVTVTGYIGDNHVVVDWEGRDPAQNAVWLRGALDLNTTTLVSMPKEAPMTTSYDPNRPYAIGDRVQITDVRTQIGGYEIGSGRSEYVGALGTVRLVNDLDSMRVDFDNSDLDSHGSWSHEALDLVTDGTGDGLNPDSPTDMDLGDGIDEVAGPTDVNPNRTLVVGDGVRFRKTSWISGGDSADVGRAMGIQPGDEGVITAEADYTTTEGEVTNYSVKWDREGSRDAVNLHMSWIDPLVADLVPTRPMIDFSSPRNKTAREYAGNLVSRVNKDDTNYVLDRIVAGHEVDAYEVNGIMPDVLSGCATRDSNSRARRERAKQARHLCHIVQAVLESHADNLPAYAEGERSRAVAAVTANLTRVEAEAARRSDEVAAKQRELDAVSTSLLDQQEKNEALRNERATLTEAASEERRRLTGEIDSLKDSVAVEQASVAYLQASLDYALAMLPASAQTKVAGFQDGYVKTQSR